MTSKLVMDSVTSTQNSSLISCMEIEIEAVMKMYRGLLNLVSNSPDEYVYQLNHFIFPIYVYVYFEFIFKGDYDEASNFCNEFIEVFCEEEAYMNAIKDMREIDSVEDIVNHPYFKKFNDEKFLIKMTEECLNYLMDFLKEESTSLLVSLISLHFVIKIIHRDDDEASEEMYEKTTPKIKEEKNNYGYFNKNPKLEVVKAVKEEPLDDFFLCTPLSTKIKDEPIDESYECSVKKEVDDDFEPCSKIFRPYLPSYDTRDKPCLSEDKFNLKKIENVFNLLSVSKIEEEEDDSEDDDDEDDVLNSNAYSSKKLDQEDEQDKMHKVKLKKLVELQTAIEKVALMDPYILPARTYDIYVGMNESERSVSDIKISCNDELMACSFDDNSIELWDLSPNPLHVVNDKPSTSNVNLHHVEESPTTCSTCHVHYLRGHSMPVYGLAFHYCNTLLLSCSHDTTIRAWDMDTFKNIVIYKGHNFPIFGVDIDGLAHHFASASMDRTCKLWDFERTFPLSTLIKHEDSVCRVKFHPNGRYIATGSVDKSIAFWDTNSSNLVRSFYGHEAGITALEFSPCGKYLASAARDKTIKIWDIAEQELVCDLKAPETYCLCYNSNGSVMASGGRNSRLRFWNMEKCIPIPEVPTEFDEENVKPELYKLSQHHMQAHQHIQAHPTEPCMQAGSSHMKLNPSSATEPMDEKLDPRLLATIPTQCFKINFVKFGKKNLVTAAGVNDKPPKPLY